MKKLLFLCFLAYSNISLSGYVFIDEKTLEGGWPFIVSKGILRCDVAGGMRFITFVANNDIYAVNGAARSRKDKLKIKDAIEILSDPENINALSNISEKGKKLCDYNDFVEQKEDTLLRFDTEKYCKEVSDLAGGSYRIQQLCLDKERQEFSKLSSMSIPVEINKYCLGIAKMAGGSYRIMRTCVEKEIDAKKNLH